jgi:hypothetical protein
MKKYRFFELNGFGSAYHMNLVLEMVCKLTKNVTCIIVQNGYLKNPDTPSSYSTIL